MSIDNERIKEKTERKFNRVLTIVLIVFLAFPLSFGVGKYDVYEQTINWSSKGYSNPWEAVTLKAVFTSPTQKTFNIDGFYYDVDTWKLRFAPNEEGTWTWDATISDRTNTKVFSGSFIVTNSANHGFVRQNPNNVYRWVFDDGTPYYPIGFGDCISAPGKPDDLSLKWGMDCQHGIDTDTFLGTYSAAGCNIFRISVNNCAPDLWSKIDPSGNVYLIPEGKIYDTLVQKLRQYNFRIFFDMMGWAKKKSLFLKNPTTQQLDAIKRYVRYIVARYGAYVDFWELMNESHADSVWYDTIGSYLHHICPYHHPISTSWQKPKEKQIDIVSPHFYYKEADGTSDIYIIGLAWYNSVVKEGETGGLLHYKSYGKPVIVGEIGNSGCNWDPTSAIRMRVRLWTAFFWEGTLIFWNTSSSKNYRNECANLYMGPEERGYIKVLRDFTNGISTQVTMVTTASLNWDKGNIPNSQPDKVRAYGLISPTEYYAYVHAYATNYSSPVATSGVYITISPQSAGVATWYSPADGSILGTQDVLVGTQSILVPDFVIDAALKITANKR